MDDEFIRIGKETQAAWRKQVEEWQHQFMPEVTVINSEWSLVGFRQWLARKKNQQPKPRPKEE